MRLWTPDLAVQRMWTVELRPQLTCPQCGPTAVHTHGATARSAALAHLAGHARLDALPLHLRTCQCHARGCRWHPRHRGCSGPVVLVLAREHGGRLWRLADACTHCAAATRDAAVVPEPQADSLPARSRQQPSSAPAGLGPRERARDMLSYLAATLPPSAGPQARLLALQCALRANRLGLVRLPGGLLRSMLTADQAAEAWQELKQARWLHHTPMPSGGRQAQLLDATVLTQAPGRPARSQAADLVLHRAYSRLMHAQPGAVRLTAVALAVHLSTGSTCGRADLADLARICAVSEAGLMAAAGCLVDVGALSAWASDPATGEVRWQYGRRGCF
ncbi:hypothetical protein ACIQZO_39555 [Streptomyces sp. NPDC097617]|uniref:hypothetical protein n=1 Tax=Streptomyces sp. NPDC097617 TaxID=3366091 RepID=UPI003830EF76